MGDYVGVFGIEIGNKILEWKITVWDIKASWRNIWFREKEKFVDIKGTIREWPEHIFEHVPNPSGSLITNIAIINTVEKDKVDDEWQVSIEWCVDKETGEGDKAVDKLKQ